MTRYAPQWLQAAQYSAAQDRALLGALWPAAAIRGMQVTVVAGMNLAVGTGVAAVPLSAAGQTALCASDGQEAIALAAAPPSGQDRVDLIVVQVRSTEVGGAAGTEDFVFAVVSGPTMAPPATPPAVPANAVAIAQVLVPGGSAAVVPGNITDRRTGQLAVPAPGVPPDLSLWGPNLGPLPKGLIGIGNQVDSNTRTSSSFANAVDLGATGTVQIRAGRYYRIRCFGPVISAAYTTGNGTIAAAISQSNGFQQIGNAFQIPTKVSNLATAFALEFVGGLAAGAFTFAFRAWGGANVNSWSLGGNAVTTTVEDLGPSPLNPG